ncbi:hypothetical protein GGF46_000161 [Coemansia sp. RSA 552]|nr:hypothetical protein GGF46_000161 [Coemansia sp. RSA 552]
MEAHLVPDSGAAAEDKPNLWETVLRSVGSSKAVAKKNVLVLGDDGSGKTGVVTQLLQASLSPQLGNGQDAVTSVAAGGMARLNESALEIDSAASLGKHDLALAYSYMDVRDEDNEDLLARVGIYQLASDRITDRELLRFVLDAQSFPNAAAVVVLDWSKPWRFVKSLLRWMNVLEQAAESVCSDTAGREPGKSDWTLGRATVEECRERLERFLQEFTETTATEATEADGAPSSLAGHRARAVGADSKVAAADVLLPLGKGVLEVNLGLPLIVVCAKADTMGVMERERGFKEEDFDYVQQVLRAVCLRFGAALIYTSTHNPATFSTLYHYLVHRLLTAPTTLPPPEAGPNLPVGDAEDGQSQLGQRSRAGSTSAPVAENANGAAKPPGSYPFRVRSNVVDRDVVFVPAGWDSAAKISYLREPFDVPEVQEAWAFDHYRYMTVVERAVREAAVASEATSDDGSAGAEQPTINNSLLHMFGGAVATPKQRAGLDANGGGAVAAVNAAVSGLANEVSVEDDQAFFERLHEEQQQQMALEGEEAEGDYGDGRARLGGASNKLVSSLLRNVHTAESSLSTASDVIDADGGNLSDDNAADADRLDSSPSAISRQPTGLSHRRTDSMGEVPAGSGSIGRAAGGRGSWKSQPPAVGESASFGRKQVAGNGGSSASSAVGVSGEGGTNVELTSFFQGLLGRKGGATPSSNTSSNGKNSPQQAAARPPPLTNSLSRSSGVSAQKDIQADLERWKAQLRRQKE